MQEARKYASVDEAAGVLGISRMTLYRACTADQVPHMRVGNRVLIPLVWLNRDDAADQFKAPAPLPQSVPVKRKRGRPRKGSR